MPYVGAGVLASAICMDKGIAKSVCATTGSPWRPGGWWPGPRGRSRSWRRPSSRWAFRSSSSPPISAPPSASPRRPIRRRWATRCCSAFEFDEHVILEEFVAGRELEFAVLGNEDVRVTRAGEIIASREFYDYDDKYVLGLAETVAPTDLTDTQLAAWAAAGRVRLPRAARRGSGAHRRVPARGRRDRDQRGEHHAGLHPDLHVPHAVGGRGCFPSRRSCRSW